MDASALIVKKAEEVEVGRLILLDGEWWVRAVVPGENAVEGALCVTGQRAGEWLPVGQESVVTLGEGWDWMADLPNNPLHIRQGQCPPASIRLTDGTPYVAGHQCHVKLGDNTAHFVSRLHGHHITKWTAVAWATHLPADRHALFEVNADVPLRSLNIRFP